MECKKKFKLFLALQFNLVMAQGDIQNLNCNSISSDYKEESKFVFYTNFTKKFKPFSFFSFIFTVIGYCLVLEYIILLIYID